MTVELTRAWLWAWLYFLGLSLGAMWFVLIHHLTLGEWGRGLKERAEEVSLGVFALIPLAVPWLLHLKLLYPWADPAHLAADPLLRHRELLFNVPFVTARTALSLLIWAGLARALWRRERCQRLGVAGMMLHLALSTNLAFDLVLSLETQAASSIFGLLLVLFQAFTALALLAILARGDAHQRHDWGSMLLAALMLTAYAIFSQLVIQWSGNRPEEVGWLATRVWGEWKGWAAVLFVAWMAVPFLLLLAGPLKRRQGSLRLIAGWITLLGPFAFYWLVWPSFAAQGGATPLIAFTLVGLLWSLLALRRRP